MGEAENQVHDYSKGQTLKLNTENPVENSFKEFPTIHGDDSKKAVEDSLLDGEIKDCSNFADDARAFEERIRSLPTLPLYIEENSHIHNEFCGHPTIIHGNHIDYLCDGELHFVARSGAVYPHKLEASSNNPRRCEFHNSEEAIFNEEKFQNSSLSEVECGNVFF